eukprot:NODE_230_length_12188_cov_0.969890.p8 type:complete len:160 gc:universal NODE_230_length_12188_cov_0.969890:2499-2020(-)
MYFGFKNELKSNPNTQFKQTEWYHYGLVSERLKKFEDAEFAFLKLANTSPTGIISVVDILSNQFLPNTFKVDRPEDQIPKLFKLYQKFMTSVNLDSFEVYFDVYGCNNYKDPFYRYMIALCNIHGKKLVQLWLLQSAISKEERRFAEDLFKYTDRLNIK